MSAEGGFNLKKSFALLLIAAVTLFAAANGAEAQMQAFSSQEGRFAIQLPGAPQYIPSDVPLTGSNTVVKLHQFAVEVGDTMAFITSYADYPASLVSGQVPDKVLQNVAKGSIADRQVLAEGVTSINGNAGRYYVAQGSDGLVFQARIYLVGTRLYQNIVVSDAASRARPEVRQFFDSFQLLK